ncbi:DEAD/DEAH box helicase [Pseudomonas oryzihabitans]|uniref:DEAD/DEAH box helicase n=1 Tax=Pseudomonas oryzihabitans TaxID=47885 RepID=UPI0009DCA67B|nr:DEAD/DEAH box helicase [Pseudomonas oryzihabitans]NMZ46181.1 DEAD/DEAH box helicase [Pseudomonas oryzihabitans]
MNKGNGLSEQAAKHLDFVLTYDKLLKKLFLSKWGVDLAEPYDDTDIKRATWLASAIALGSSEHLKNLASSYGTLLYQSDPSNTLYKKACYILQSRTGNLLASRHLYGIFENGVYQESFGSSLNLELSAKRGYLSQDLEGCPSAVFTDYQKQLWDKLSSRKNVAISAPTSAGKSFIIQRYIVAQAIASPATIFYVVPTKALVNQVAMTLKSALLKSSKVYTTYRALEDSTVSTIFVLTPERCMKVFQDFKLADPSIVFFDEIQNLEEQGRGLILEDALYRMIGIWRSTQFLFAGPYVENIASSINKLVDLELEDMLTVATPVVQIKAGLTFRPRMKQADYKLFSPTGNVIEGQFSVKTALYSKVKTNKGEALAGFFRSHVCEGSCIVFSPRKGQAEKWALKIAPYVGMSNPDIVDGASQGVRDLIDFLADEIYPEYVLIRTLRMGVAFHHGGLPDIVRLELESLYLLGDIKHLVCTTTLIQGVNLPADKLIIINPSAGTHPLSSLEFLNLIGRAGRISNSMYGEVYCLDIVGDEWAEKRFTDSAPTEIKPSSLAFIENNSHDLLYLIGKEKSEILSADESIENYQSIAYLRQLYIADEPHFDRLMNQAKISDDIKRGCRKKLEGLAGDIKIPINLLKMNPHIDPLLQDKFYRDVLDDGVWSWMPNKTPFIRGGGPDSEFHERSLYYQFDNIVRRLNGIFEIESDLNVGRFGRKISIGSLVFDAYKWMSGESHRYFIEKLLDDSTFEGFVDTEDVGDSSKIDTAARFVTGYISRSIAFILVRYLSIWSDVVSSFLSEADRERYAYQLSLPAMIELGSYDPKVLEMMSLGINRSVALKIKRILPPDVSDIEGWLRGYDGRGLSPLYLRYLKRGGFISK